MPWRSNITKFVSITLLKIIKIGKETVLINLSSNLGKEELKSAKGIVVELKNLVPFSLEKNFISNLLTTLIEKNLLIQNNINQSVSDLEVNLLQSNDLKAKESGVSSNFICAVDKVNDKVESFDLNVLLHQDNLDPAVQNFVNQPYSVMDYYEDDKTVLDPVENGLYEFSLSDTIYNLKSQDQILNDVFDDEVNGFAQDSILRIDEKEDINNENISCYSNDECEDFLNLFENYFFENLQSLNTANSFNNQVYAAGTTNDLNHLYAEDITNIFKHNDKEDFLLPLENDYRQFDSEKTVEKCQKDIESYSECCSISSSASFSEKPNSKSLSDKIYERRRKNNIASKFTRAKRKKKHHELYIQATELEKSNAELKIKIDVMQKQVNHLREIIIDKLTHVNIFS
ncbi:uncharacterized protein LOC100204325 [Hydra vulgaris]|uniref:Uncharacterized protein LOC100204325 n=1 Tax=Hydra vulgaris TaxID=6087 RepID=A0ABM4DEQ9_HYDVU